MRDSNLLQLQFKIQCCSKQTCMKKMIDEDIDDIFIFILFMIDEEDEENALTDWTCHENFMFKKKKC